MLEFLGRVETVETHWANPTTWMLRRILNCSELFRIVPSFSHGEVKIHFQRSGIRTIWKRCICLTTSSLKLVLSDPHPVLQDTSDPSGSKSMSPRSPSFAPLSAIVCAAMSRYGCGRFFQRHGAASGTPRKHHKSLGFHQP